jgi:hypothetical protein
MDTLAQCFKSNIGPHFAIGKAIGQEKKYDKDLTTWQKFKIWFIIFLASILPFSLYTVDVSTDSALVVKYDSERDGSHVNHTCESLINDLNNECSVDILKLTNLADISSELSMEARFNYSLAFMLFPIISFALEWYSDHKKILTWKRLKIEVGLVHCFSHSSCFDVA